MKFLGIDGGGTKTEFLIIDENGTIQGYVIKPTCHYKQTSLDNFEKILTEGIEEVCRQVEITLSQIDYSFIGVPGYGEISDDIKDIESIVKRTLGSDSYKCSNDAVVAWAGSLACQPGINIVAGTGAIGFGIDVEGNSARAGGWGPFCGDEGSAYWLGKKAIELFSKESDGRLEKTPLYHIMRSALEIEDDFDLIEIVNVKYGLKRDKIAGLSKILYEASKEDDEKAKSVFTEAAYEHYLTIKSIINKLSFSLNEELLISYSGGVFKSGKYVLDPLESYLEGLNLNIKLIRPILKPITGAGLLAAKEYLKDIDNSLVESLKLEEEKLKFN